MEGEDAVEALGLLIDGPVELVAEVDGEAPCGEHGAWQAEVMTGAAQLLDGFLHVLHGDEGHGVEVVADAAVLVVDVVVEGAADGDGVVGVLDEAHGEAGGGEHDGLLDVGLCEELDPVLTGAGAELAGVDAFAAAGAGAAACGMCMPSRPGKRGRELRLPVVEDLKGSSMN